MTTDTPVPLPEGMETTESERENWRNAAKQDGGDFGYGGALTIGRHWFLRLLRDFDRQSAEVARLTAALPVPPDREKAAIELVFQAKCLTGSLHENARAAMHAAALLLRSSAPPPAAERDSTIAVWKGKRIRELESEVARLTAALATMPVTRKLYEAQTEVERLTAALAEANARSGRIEAKATAIRARSTP